MKIGVVFNCQHDGLAQSLRLLRPDDTIISFGYPALAASADNVAVALNQLATCSAVIMSPTSGNLRPAVLRRLQAAAPRTVLLPAISFGGFHPDALYLDLPKGQQSGPTEALHSRVAIGAFLAGLSVDEAGLLYNRLVFERLGYGTQFAVHRALLINRFAQFGVTIEPWFEQWQTQGCFMHSPNHPKIPVLVDLARMACQKLDLFYAATSEVPTDILALGARHPVHEDVARRLGVEAETKFYGFGSRDAAVARGIFTLPAFLAACFAVYPDLPRASLQSANGVMTAMQQLGLSETKPVPPKIP